MQENARVQKPLSTKDASNQDEKDRSSQQQGEAAKLPAQTERRTQSVIREPVDPDEQAMDVALGGEGKPWVERKKPAAGSLPGQTERRTQSVIRKPVDPDEQAMDIALGGEGKPWVERKKPA